MKNKTNKILGVLLIIAAIIGMLPNMNVFAVGNEQFTDVESGRWYYNDVLEAKKLKLITGDGQGRFNPNNVITYAEFITALVRVFEDEIEDVEGRWYDKYIRHAEGNGIIESGDIENPLAEIPRQDMIKFSVRALGIEPVDASEIIFEDTLSISDEERGYINSAFKEYLTEGTGRSEEGLRQFGYDKTSLRCELATILLRIKKYKDDPIAYKEERKKAREEAEKAFQEHSGEQRTVSFDPEEDILPNGKMKPEKEQEFIELILDNLSIYKGQDGKCYIEFKYPDDIPDGYIVDWEFHIVLKDYKAGTHLTTWEESRVEEHKIPMYKGFKRIVNGATSVDDIWYFVIEVAIGKPNVGASIFYYVTWEDAEPDEWEITVLDYKRESTKYSSDYDVSKIVKR
ncbi:MAG: S-layer homology domain-containing protein [Acetivibrionales bacterium]